MRIHNQSVTEILKTYIQQKKAAAVEKAPAAPKDGIELSAEARLFSVAMQALRELPETDSRKLEELKEAVKTRTYQVSSQEVAEKIWQESSLDKQI